MRSRKSILNKGIVFVLSVFAFAIFSFTKINAACEVSFNDGNQYLTLAGDISMWSDSGLKSIGCDVTIKSLTINGGESAVTSFIPSGAGHYTVGYNYTYNDGSKDINGVIYRYVRVLNSNLETSNNYSAVTFDFDDTSSASVIDSFLIEDYYFANFIVHNGSTYVVIKDTLGRQASEGIVELKDPNYSFVATKVIKDTNNYYVIGNNVEGNGVLVGYQITVSSDEAYISHIAGVNYTSNKSIYNGAYLDGTTLYIAGQSSDGYPIIDSYVSGTQSRVYTHTVLGAYNGVVSKNNTVYAVGYTKANSTISTGLYTYISVGEEPVYRSIISGADTVFNDIVMYNNQNIIIGRSEVNSINANNVLAATNNRQGFSDGIILRVSSDGQSVTGAYMLGGPVHDEFTSIKLIKGTEYVVTGTMNDGASSLVYRLDASSFEATMDITSSNDKYKVNGIASWNYGYAYYGEIVSNSILGVYYPLSGTNYADAMFISLDNRVFENYQTIPFTTSEATEHKYCDYPLRFGLSSIANKDSYVSLECKKNDSAVIEVTTIGTSSMTYRIDDNTGVTIYVYRLIKVTQDPEPINLDSTTSTGILKWYVYNRPEVITYASRTPTTDFNYVFNGDVHNDETIEDMIKYYIEHGNSNGYELQFVEDENEPHKTFTNSNQTSAAFATIEYAKMFAYYQEFSRVVRMDGSKLYSELGAVQYSDIINAGTPYYIYYIDYRGNNAANSDVYSCSVTITSVGNCTAKGGYAFSNLRTLKEVIEKFIVYNNFFVSTRNTIYNGSVEASEINAYKQMLTTKEYTKSLSFANAQTQLTFNVEKDDGTTSYYSGSGKTVYFGGTLGLDGVTMSHSLMNGTQTVRSVTSNGITYYEGNSAIFFTHNACYKVYYSNNNNEVGTPRYFCLDTTAPTIEYKKDNSDSVTTQAYPSMNGSEPGQPLYVEADFTITDLIDLDDYAFIYVNGNRYPIQCEPYKSEQCLADVDKYIKQTFRYDSSNPLKLQTIEFSDRLSNKNIFYFVIGTLAPNISVENETDEGFTLVIDFYKTNPIDIFQASVSYQSCETESAGNCYVPFDPDNKDTAQQAKDVLDINFDLEEFNRAVTNYIYAVSYRDRENNGLAEFEIISAKEGIYTIDGIDYIIEDGYFVEHKGYEESYAIDSQNIFEYRGEKYAYDILSKSIQKVTLDENDQYVSDGSDSIPLINDTFKFESTGKLYTIVDDEGILSVEVLPQSYEIYDEDKFKINNTEYVINYENEEITFVNPVLGELKRIRLEFYRTTLDNQEQAGVRIPKTEQVFDKNNLPVIDNYTGKEAYIILEEELHFNVVDGVYTFMISHDFPPGVDSVETKINVEPLELNAGYVSYIEGLTVEKDKVVEYDTIYDENRANTTLFVTSLIDQFRYPLSADVVSTSNLTAYENTHFLDRTVYFSYPRLSEEDNSVLIIRVYDKKNSYGLPNIDNATACTEIIIYGNVYTKNPISSVLCSESLVFPYSNISSNTIALKNLGIHKLFEDNAFFALNGQNVFYDIYLKSFEKDKNGIYQPSAVTANKTFYLDAVSPAQDTIEAYVYDNKEDETEDPTNVFTLVDGVYRLNNNIGSTLNVGFNINWYNAGVAQDYRENKLLLMTIYDGSSSVTCNVFQAINNENYNTDCKKYIDMEESYSTSDSFRLVFSSTGSYEVTFTDASGNGVTYIFVIDKTAPNVALTGVSMEIKGEQQILNYDFKDSYYVISYVKNASFSFIIEDLSEITSYCYYFDYGQGTKTNSCSNGSNNNIVVVMNDYEGIKDYLETNNIDSNITLVIWAYDKEGNHGEDNPTKVLFWVDYKEPEVSSTTDTNLNTSVVGNVALAGLEDKTITVLTGDYSGKDIICDSETGFSFIDYRYVTIPAPYKFVLNCSDTHNTLTDDYPDIYGFDNTMHIKFYEWNGTERTGVFNFGRSTDDGYARWIYITVEDVVGNESDQYVVLPISVIDRIAPSVSKVEKDVDGDRTLLGNIEYSYQEGKRGYVYLANTKIYVTFSESIASLLSCKTIIANNEAIIYEGSCDDAIYGDGYSDGQEFEYEDNRLEFEFNNDIENTYKLIIFEVADFADLTSGEVIIVIDKLAPIIDFKEGGEEDDTIEYITQTGKKYDNSYISSGYAEHVFAQDDQNIGLTVSVLYTKYSPTVTRNNYIKQGQQYVPVENGTPRVIGTEYYLLIKSNSLVNKKCETDQIIGTSTYCFVKDTQSFYYFDSLLNDESGNIWQDVNVIDASAIGVYRVAYYVTDYVGNISGTIYKKVFVNDTDAPDLDIYTSDATRRLYSNVTSNNPDNFEGKLNILAGLQGTDSAVGSQTRIVLYRCLLGAYENRQCDINQPLFSQANVTGLAKGESKSDFYAIGTTLNDGIYKAFVYDMGSYLDLESSSIYHDTGHNETGKVYSLTHNSSHVYFAINMSTITANYTIYGNKYQNHTDGDFEFVYSDLNYYKITNSSATQDVYLVRYIGGRYQDVSGSSAIGFSGSSVEFNQTGKIITVTYRDSNNRIIYQVKYEEYETDDGLFLHETYHMVDIGNKNAYVCRIVNGENECLNSSIVYKVQSVEAYIYPDGEYVLQMRDRYGNYSKEVEALVVDNSAYTVNKEATKATGVNYWFSVPKSVVTDANAHYFVNLVNVNNNSDINVLDSKYTNNFNSDFFYAFASKEDAKNYLVDIYTKEIELQIENKGSFDFYGIDGNKIDEYTSDTGSILGAITNTLYKMVFTTYTPQTNFSDTSIKQIAYSGNEEFKLSSSMYKYAYLLVTTTINANHEVSHTYEYKGETCEVSNATTQQCIKVDLSIENANNNYIDLTVSNDDLVSLTCRISGTGESGSLDESACNNLLITSGATYLFIETEEHKYHRNVVYYGITAYTMATKIEYVELGDYIPLSEFTRYKQEGNSYQEDENGEYIWVDSKFVAISSIRNTNLLIEKENACTFNSTSYDECVFVTYLSRYHKGGDGKYNPSSTGNYYYNYYTKTYDEKKAAMDKIGADSTFSDDGKRSEGTNGENVPVKVIVIDNVSVDFANRFNKQTNKKVYIELFNSNNSSINTTIFEINAIQVDGKYREVYSYATLIINNVPYNINQFITFDEYSYKCIIDIDINSKYEIKIIDRAGNTLNLTFAHSNYVPNIIYTENSEDTTSNVTIEIETESIVSSISKNYVKVYKYEKDDLLGEWKFKEYENIDSACVYYLTNVSDTSFVQKLTMEFRYSQYSYCSGIYRIEVRDNHNNTRYKDFVFNPYYIETNYELDHSRNIYEYTEKEISGVITNGNFTVNVDTKLYYLIIKQYAVYSNLNLGEPLNAITLTNFDSNTTIGNCLINIDIVSGYVYSVSIDGVNNDCDGIYTVDLVNKFSETILELGLTHLEGANQEVITSRVVYNDSTTVEIDTTAPKGDYIGEELYFDVYVDEVLNINDTKTLIETRQLSYKNKYIAIHWGGSKDHSMVYLKYNIRSIDDDSDVAWVFHTTGVTYEGQYNSSYVYIPDGEGEYIFEFMFTDVLGNENAEKTYQIIIRIEAPNVGLFEVNDNPDIVGAQYENDNDNPVRIGDRTILKCLVELGSAYIPQACDPNDYTYKIYLNDIDASLAYINVEHGINYTNSIISKDAIWIKNLKREESDSLLSAKEIHVKVVVGVVGKEENIKTELNIIIDQRAPDISFTGNSVGSTYKYAVKVNVKANDDYDTTNTAVIYQCDVNPNQISECLIYNDNKELVTSNKVIGVIENGRYDFEVSQNYSGYFMVVARDALSNVSFASFTLDNQAPTMTITSNGVPIAQNMYTNSNVVVNVNDVLSQQNSSFEVEYIPLLSKQGNNQTPVAPTGCQASGAILSCEGKYTLTPVDGVGIVGRSITFYIYKQAPDASVVIDDDLQGAQQAGYRVGEKAYLLWNNDYTLDKYNHNAPDLYAPIVNITLDGKLYNSTFDKEHNNYVGDTVETIGEHTIVLIDAAGNRKVIMFTINNTSKVCINGKEIEVKLQAYYDINNLMIGNEEGKTYEKNDVIIFALPSQASSGQCIGKGLLGYRTLDPKNSYYLLDSDRNVELFNQHQYNFVEYGFISDKAIQEVKNVGGTVVVFVVTKDIANNRLGYSVGTNFFMEDPIGWTMIFVTLLGLVWPVCRIFIKKKVRVI